METIRMEGLDTEWLTLIFAAKDLGITKEEVLSFLNQPNVAGVSPLNYIKE